LPHNLGKGMVKFHYPQPKKKRLAQGKKRIMRKRHLFREEIILWDELNLRDYVIRLILEYQEGRPDFEPKKKVE
jgi:hypothetical protein